MTRVCEEDVAARLKAVRRGIWAMRMRHRQLHRMWRQSNDPVYSFAVEELEHAADELSKAVRTRAPEEVPGVREHGH